MGKYRIKYKTKNVVFKCKLGVQNKNLVKTVYICIKQILITVLSAC